MIRDHRKESRETREVTYTVYTELGIKCSLVYVTISAKKPDLFAQACILRKMKFKIIHKITHATKKEKMQVFIRPVLEEGRLKSIKTIYHIIHLLMESLKIFCSSNGMHVVCVCLQCGKRKRDRHHFLYQTPFISMFASDYSANTIPLLMY